MPDLDNLGKGKSCQNEREDHRRGLRGNHDAPAVVPVGYRSTDGGEKENRDLAGKTHDAKKNGRPGETIDEP